MAEENDIDEILNARMKYRVGDKTKTGTRLELFIIAEINQALQGDAKSAELICTMYKREIKLASAGHAGTRVIGGLPPQPRDDGREDLF